MPGIEPANYSPPLTRTFQDGSIRTFQLPIRDPVMNRDIKGIEESMVRAGIALTLALDEMKVPVKIEWQAIDFSDSCADDTVGYFTVTRVCPDA